jgi:hypothetical protein
MTLTFTLPPGMVIKNDAAIYPYRSITNGRQCEVDIPMTDIEKYGMELMTEHVKRDFLTRVLDSDNLETFYKDNDIDWEYHSFHKSETIYDRVIKVEVRTHSKPNPEYALDNVVYRELGFRKGRIPKPDDSQRYGYYHDLFDMERFDDATLKGTSSLLVTLANSFSEEKFLIPLRENQFLSGFNKTDEGIIYSIELLECK